jgi:hypothetical protein
MVEESTRRLVFSSPFLAFGLAFAITDRSALRSSRDSRRIVREWLAVKAPHGLPGRFAGDYT